ncbi:MAG: LysR family transcriptional regulator [Phycisphaerales bacterium]|nr:LysR family transcriptional regulator [Phycisphaerales bacterium]
MELTPLRYFRAIAEAGHMTRAARTLGVSQPALSAMLKKLEAEVGASLVHRTARGVELTEAGRVFLVHAQDTLRRADGAVRAVRQLIGLEAGSIRVGAGATATSYLLPPVVSALRAKHPGLRFYVRETGSSAVAAAVLSGELDLGLVTLPIRGPGEEELLKTPLVEDELRLIRRREGEAKRRRDGVKKEAGPATFRWKDIEGEPFVAFEAGTAVRAIIDQAAAAAGVTLNVVMELRSIESIKQMVAAGIGVALVSRFALEPGEGQTCREAKLTRRLALIRRKDREPSVAAAAFEREMLAAVRSTGA